MSIEQEDRPSSTTVCRTTVSLRGGPRSAGPATSPYADANALATTATFDAAGTYVIEFAATDGQLTNRLARTVVVVDPNGPANQPPVVGAGTSQTVVLPGTTATLSGMVHDDGLPSASLSLTWSLVSGPASVTFANPYALSTEATFGPTGV